MQNDPKTSSTFFDNPPVSIQCKKISRILWYTALYCKTVQSPMAHSYVALANVKHALSPTLTLSFRPQLHSFFIRQHFACLSSNFICCIKCGLLYIGRTGRSLRVRFGEHCRLVNNHDNTKPVARHFTSGCHCVSDMKIGALCSISGMIAVNIHRLGTPHPSGINE